MLGLRVPKNRAEEAKKYLAMAKLTDYNYRVIGDSKFIYFPLRAGSGRIPAGIGGARVVEMAFAKAHDRQDVGSVMASLGVDRESYAGGYDRVGDIAVVSAKDRKTALKLAKVIMASNSSIKTVLSKGGPVSGVYRTRKYVYVAGKKNFVGTYRENGCVFNVDLRKSFFSPRLAFERDRISRLVKKGENVMVMFAGVGPFAIEIAKRRKDANVVAIELNRDAYRNMLENIRLNKAVNVEARLGDVHKIAKEYRGFADRIIMPLPMDSSRFLDSVAIAARHGCVVHYYAFGDKDDAFRAGASMLKEFFSKKGMDGRLLFKRVVRPYSANEVEIVLDFQLKRRKKE